MGNYNGLFTAKRAIADELQTEFMYGVTVKEFEQLFECITKAPFHVSMEFELADAKIINGEVETFRIIAHGSYFSGRDILSIDKWGTIHCNTWMDGRNTSALLYALNEWLMSE